MIMAHYWNQIKILNNPEYVIITYDIEPKDNLNTEGEGQVTCYPIQ